MPRDIKINSLKEKNNYWGWKIEGIDAETDGLSFKNTFPQFFFSFFFVFPPPQNILGMNRVGDNDGELSGGLEHWKWTAPFSLSHTFLGGWSYTCENKWVCGSHLKNGYTPLSLPSLSSFKTNFVFFGRIFSFLR